MIRFVFVLVLLCSTPAAAQLLLGVDKGGGGGVSYTGPGNINTATMWWGLRPYSAADTSVAINACRAGDSACADIGVDTTVGLKVADLNSLGCNDTTQVCTVKTIYDKTGGGLSFAQATEALRPTLVISCDASLPCLTSTATTWMAATCGTVAQAFTAVVVANRTTVGVNPSIFESNGGNTAIGYRNAANLAGMLAPTLLTATVTDATWNVLQAVFNDTSGDLHVNATTNAGTVGANGLSGACVLFNDVFHSLGFIGKWREGGVFASTTLATMNSNIHTFWGF